ncbi:hypothetical protein SKAU_G00394430 [Synaphobranchus kaupii]|uniref:Uncharacterized protein n=1 Tax=Synaphobranchus kaupii TaxID=118154 RepID=A0A9Q1EC65_SYNKA|nr:hypothetical protein SKAU_G00394430 [Synaphobranchus kaupii]
MPGHDAPPALSSPSRGDTRSLTTELESLHLLSRPPLRNPVEATLVFPNERELDYKIRRREFSTKNHTHSVELGTGGDGSDDVTAEKRPLPALRRAAYHHPPRPPNRSLKVNDSPSANNSSTSEPQESRGRAFTHGGIRRRESPALSEFWMESYVNLALKWRQDRKQSISEHHARKMTVGNGMLCDSSVKRQRKRTGSSTPEETQKRRRASLRRRQEEVRLHGKPRGLD